MGKKNLFIIILVLFTNSLNAQNWYRNYEKYWWYHYRLVNDFMKIGPNAGESIPAYVRMRGYTGQNTIQPGYLHWGDATQALGRYLSVLALEHRILKNNSWDVTRTDMENYYAQTAFERLDRYAETYCNNIQGTYPNNGSPGGPDYNGFFIRDDVAGNFVFNGNVSDYNFKHFNRPKIVGKNPVGNNSNLFSNIGGNACLSSGYQVPATGGVVSDYYHRAWMTTSQWYDIYCPLNVPPNVSSSTLGTLCFPPAKSITGAPPQYPKEESQDQLVEMMVGFGLTAFEAYDGTYNGQNLNSKAQNNAYRAVTWVASQPDPFIIKNPLTNHCIYGNEDGQFFCPVGCAAAGGIVKQASPALTKTAHMIYGSQYSTTWIQTIAAGFAVPFQLTQLTTGSNAYYQDNYVAFANDWHTLYLPVPFNTTINTSWSRLKKHAIAHNFQTPHIPLIYRLINSPGNGVGDFDPTDKGEPSYENLLNVSVFCGNYAYNNDGTAGDWRWSSQDVMSFAGQRGSGNNGDFNNTDYMELFNLYALVKHDYLQWIINPYYAENYNINYPDGNGYGSSSNHLILNYLEYLSLINKIYSNANMTFRGAKVVDMLPGFNTDLGAVYTAYVEDYDCDPGNEYHYAVLNNNPIEYNPTGLGYQRPASTNPEQADYSDLVSEEKENYYADSLIVELKKSGDYEWMMQMFPELHKYEHQNEIVSTSDDVSLYSNPNAGNFIIKFPAPGIYQIKVMNMYGNEVYHTVLNNGYSITIELGDVPSGNYIVDITGSNKSVIKKITVIK